MSDLCCYQSVWSCATRAHKLLQGVSVARPPKHSAPISVPNFTNSVTSNSSSSGVNDYNFSDFNLPSRELNLSGLMDAQQDFMLMNETPWDSAFDILLPPSNLISPQQSGQASQLNQPHHFEAPFTAFLRNPYNAHLALFEGIDSYPTTEMDGVDSGNGNGTGTSLSGTGSNGQSGTDSKSKSASSEPQRRPYM